MQRKEQSRAGQKLKCRQGCCHWEGPKTYQTKTNPKYTLGKWGNHQERKAKRGSQQRMFVKAVTTVGASNSTLLENSETHHKAHTQGRRSWDISNQLLSASEGEQLKSWVDSLPVLPMGICHKQRCLGTGKLEAGERPGDPRSWPIASAPVWLEVREISFHRNICMILEEKHEYHDLICCKITWTMEMYSRQMTQNFCQKLCSCKAPWAHGSSLGHAGDWDRRRAGVWELEGSLGNRGRQVSKKNPFDVVLSFVVGKGETGKVLSLSREILIWLKWM